MNTRQLLLRNLLFFWKTNLAVILGVIAATAVIGGALVVGDSVRDSLKQMTLDRLGAIDHIVSGPRFFREELANANLNVRHVAPAIIMQGTVEFSGAEKSVLRAGHVNVYGVDERAWELFDTANLDAPKEGKIVLNRRVADQLQLKMGDEISLVVEIPASIPRDALLGDREETITEMVLSVSGIAEDTTGLARFGLNPTQQLPLNAFISLRELQTQTGLAEVQRSKRNPTAKSARVNTLLISTDESTKSLSPLTAQAITSQLSLQITLSDLALRLVENPEHGYLSFESEQMILDDTLATKAVEATRELNVKSSPVLVYLLNEVSNADVPVAGVSSAKDSDRYSMYPVIAGVDFNDTIKSPPFGPWEFIGDHEALSQNAVYLNDWLAEDLKVALGDRIRIQFYEVGDRGELPEAVHEFKVHGVMKLSGSAADSGFTPNVPGVTDAETYDDWKAPFPLKKDKITSRDDTYWDDYRTTPKLFTSLETAQQLWQSKYGSLTSLRLASKENQSLEELAREFETTFLASLEPSETALYAQPVKFNGLKAAQGTTDFTGLFIGFSFFLILAATILVGLLFRLGIEQRINEFGLLSAIGLSPKQVRKQFLFEGAWLVGSGGALGCLAAIGYAAVMIYGLKTWWIGAIGTRFLYLSVNPISLLIGFGITVLVALLAVWWALRQTKGHSTRELLSGEISDSAEVTAQQGRLARRCAWFTLSGSSVLLVMTLLGLLPETEAFGGFSIKTVLFFVIGIGFLTGSLTLLSAALTSNSTLPIKGTGTPANLRLGLRNAARNRSRSVLTASLIACATFVIVAVAAGQQDPTALKPRHNSANGGFMLIAETNVPILNDLNTAEGRAKLGFDPLNTEQNALLDNSTIMPFRVRPGENASCLNLYQTQLPTILGIPDNVLDEFIANHRFTFANTPGEQPWTLIQQQHPSGSIPVLGDMNTLMYSLHKPIGGTIDVPNSDNPEHTLEVMGMFNNSIFQGVLVMSETNFKTLFPEQVGYQYFLIECDPPQAAAITTALESSLGDYGFDAELVSDRLADFLSVQNTYLSTFQSLGGLGLLLGTIGLATVMLRNVLERRKELSLLRAVGFGKAQVATLVIWENAFLLSWGLTAGTISALLAMSPHLTSTSSALPWASLLILLGTVFSIGMFAALLAVKAAVQTPILSTLRGE